MLSLVPFLISKRMETDYMVGNYDIKCAVRRALESVNLQQYEEDGDEDEEEK